jgi:transposase
MRGKQENQVAMFSYVSQEDRIPENHPLRAIKKLVEPILSLLSPHFSKLYSDTGRPSIPPEQLLKALLLQIFYTIRSERLLMEQLDYNLLFRWFVGLSMDDEVWDHSVFSKNRDRLLEGDIATKFLKQVLELAGNNQLLSDEHFTVDGTLIDAWAGQKSFVKKEYPQASTGDDHDSGNPTVNFHGEKRSNNTHESTTDPQARLYRKSSGTEAKLCFLGNAVIDNRHGLVVNTEYTQATGTAEREAGLEMMKRLRKKHKNRMTLGADKAYDATDFVTELRGLNITPHVAVKISHGSNIIDTRTVRHQGYAISQRKRKIIEEFFGWLKTIGLMRKTRHRGLERGGWMFTFTAALYNLLRIRNILGMSV